ncbi:MAG: 50S ribosomal protein L10, partial [Actinobacteria bacterium]|nr:50S ribosomal protein L10 [Actinomycetota bacterium]
MALTRTQKTEVLADLSEILDQDQTVTFVRFDRLSVGRIDELRSQLREDDVRLQVVKKTLLGVALDDAEVAGDKPEFPGQIALTYGPGKTASARGLHNFKVDADAGEELEIVGGIFNGEYRGQESMMEIAQIPSTEELRGMFVNLISSPVSGFAVALDQYAQKQEA